MPPSLALWTRWTGAPWPSWARCVDIMGYIYFIYVMLHPARTLVTAATTHIYITTTNIYIFTIYVMFAPGQDPRNGSYYSPMHGNLGLGGKERPGEVELEQEADPLDPLLTVGSYVQPGYIYVCDNYWHSDTPRRWQIDTWYPLGLNQPSRQWCWCFCEADLDIYFRSATGLNVLKQSRGLFREKIINAVLNVFILFWTLKAFAVKT